MSSLPTSPVTPAPELTEYWDGTKRDVLLVPRCKNCGEWFWYPRGFCPLCHSTDLEWLPAGGGGTIYTFSIARRGFGPWGEAAPYVVAYVELDEGPKMLTNIVDCDPEALVVGQRVRLTFDEAGDYKIPRFRPEGER